MALLGAVAEDTRSTKPCQTFKGHTDGVEGVIHLRSGQRIMTCSNDGSLGVWDLQTGRQTENWEDGKNDISAIALSVDGKRVVSGSKDGVMKLWSIETKRVIAKWTEHTAAIWSVCWNRNDERVLSGSHDGTARVLDVETGNTVLKIDTGLGWVNAAIFSPDSSIIATCGSSQEDEFIKIWDADTGKLISILKGHMKNVLCLAWSTDGRTLISGSIDESIRTWNASTWQQIAVFTGHTNSIEDIAVSPNGRILASASHDHTVRLWNLENGQPIGLPLHHQNIVNCATFSLDGMLLATGCYDNNAYTWDISTRIKEAVLDELNDAKSFLHADATRRPVQQAKNPSPFPKGFFDDSLDHPNSAAEDPVSVPSVFDHNSEPLNHPEPAIAHSISPDSILPDIQPDTQPSSSEPKRSLFSKWLHRSKVPARPTVLQQAPEQQQRHDGEAMELHERPLPVVEVPLGQIKFAATVNLPTTPATTTPPATATPPTPHPDADAILIRAGCLISFLLRFRCLSRYSNSRL